MILVFILLTDGKLLATYIIKRITCLRLILGYVLYLNHKYIKTIFDDTSSYFTHYWKITSNLNYKTYQLPAIDLTVHFIFKSQINLIKSARIHLPSIPQCNYNLDIQIEQADSIFLRNNNAFCTESIFSQLQYSPSIKYNTPPSYAPK